MGYMLSTLDLDQMTFRRDERTYDTSLRDRDASRLPFPESTVFQRHLLTTVYQWDTHRATRHSSPLRLRQRSRPPLHHLDTSCTPFEWHPHMDSADDLLSLAIALNTLVL